MMNRSGTTDTDLSLLRLVPEVRRARGWRLYTVQGTRLTDLWQYGGAALLGHTPSLVLRDLKNTAERGLFVPFPHHLEQRFSKALSHLLPGRHFRLYADEGALRSALAKAGYDAAVPFTDPAADGDGSAEAISLWRPFLNTAFDETPILVPVLPMPWAPKVLALTPSLSQAFPDGDLISPVILAAAARSIHDLVAVTPGRGTVPYHKLSRALKKSPWRHRGIYLYHAHFFGNGQDREAYAALFRRFLENGFLLPPDPAQPLILPGELSPGEEAKLAGLLGN
ncbi:hypothetical protein FACS1894141_2180 [Spirochaetia bacterium]|nr:hypothetical protein FACS1894141_2180 [Spirochaetia bacterium]